MVSVIDVQKAYLAYFGRPADPVGLNYWMNSDTATMRAGFAASAEYAELYSGMTAEQRVEQVYQNLLGRPSDFVGKAYWVNEFNAGRETVSSLVVSMQTNALGVDIGTINNRVTYAILFTAELDTLAEVNGYSGTAASAAARGAMSSITYTDASLAAARATLVPYTASVVAGVDPSVVVVDTEAPTMISAAVSADGLSVVVTYSEALIGTAEAGDYGVTLSANSTTVTGATISGNTVTLTVSNTIPTGVTVSNLVYTATAGTVGSIKDAAANSAATQTLASVTNGSTATTLSFTLTTALADNLVGGVGADTFTGTYGNGAGPYTLNAGDILDGAGGNDTLRITTGAEASTPGDGLWTNKTNFEIMEFESTGAGAQTVTTGVNFAAAFATGANLSVTTLLGAINVDMTGYAPIATINTTTTGDGAHTIVTGTGAATVNATAVAAGAQTINGVGLTTVNATVAGAGDQTIGTTTSGSLVTVNATVSGAGFQAITSTSGLAVTIVASAAAGAQTITTAAGADSVTVTTAAGQTATISTGAGNDTIVASLGTDTITGGTGADTMTGGGGVDTFVYLLGDNTNGTADADTITVSLTGGVLDDIFSFTGLLGGATTKAETLATSVTVAENSITVVNTGATAAGVGFANSAAEVYALFGVGATALTAIGSMAISGNNAIIITAADATNSAGLINMWYVEEANAIAGITAADVVELLGTFTIGTGVGALATASSAANYV